MPLKGGKNRLCCDFDNRILFYKKIFTLFPDIRYNPETQDRAFRAFS